MHSATKVQSRAPTSIVCRALHNGRETLLLFYLLRKPKSLCCADFLGKWLDIIWHLHHVTIVAMIIFGQMKGRLRWGHLVTLRWHSLQDSRKWYLLTFPFANQHTTLWLCVLLSIYLVNTSPQNNPIFVYVDIYTLLYFCINIFCFFIFIANTSAPMSIIWDTTALLLCSCVACVVFSYLGEPIAH